MVVTSLFSSFGASHAAARGVTIELPFVNAHTADEPRTADAVTAWVRAHARDRFADVYAASEAHRLEHGDTCTVYASSNGPLLATLAAACGARRVLEVGTGLGYSALHLAEGSSPGGVVHTIERDASHAELARAQIEALGMGGACRWSSVARRRCFPDSTPRSI